MSGERGGRRVWFNAALGALVIIGAVGAYTSIGSKTQAATVSRTVRAEKGVVLATVSATGNVKAPTELAVNFETGGTLTSVTVQEGQKVTRGQVLATEDSVAAENQVKTAKASLASAQANLQKLLDGMTPREKQQNAVAVEQANASLGNAEKSLAATKSVAKQSTASSTLSLSQAKEQQKVDEAQLASDQADLNKANKDVATAQAAYDAATAQANRDQAAYDSANATLQAAQKQQTADSGDSALHQQEQSQHQTTLSNAKSNLQTAQQTQQSSCSSDPLGAACASATAATASAQSAVNSAQAQVDADTARATEDQKKATANQLAVSDASNAASAAQTALSDSKTEKNTAKSDLTSDENTRDADRTAVDNQKTKLRTDANQVETAQANLGSTEQQNAQSEQNAQTAVVNAQESKKSTVAGNAVKEQSASAADMANAEASVATAEANLATAQTSLDQATLTAPASGTIASIGATVGGTVSGGGTTAASSADSTTGAAASTPLFTLVDLDGLEVEAGFSETDAAKIRIGQAATVGIDALPDEKFAAHVVSIDTLSTVVSNVVTYNVTFQLDNPTAKVKPGMSADVDVIVAQADNAISVSSSAVQTVGNRSTVTVRRKGEDVSVAVVTGIKGDSSTEIVTGLTAGAEVVLPTTTLTSSTGGLPSGLPAGGPPGGLGGLGG